MRYAGFWLRFVAYLIDAILLWVCSFILSFIFGVSAIGMAALTHDPNTTLGPLMLYEWILFVGTWLYFALMESSTKQGTLGKMALGLRVTELNGQRITFGRATGRYFAKIISSILFLIGYLLAGWTKKKQGLHDMIAGTLVVRKES
ncbi:hypothetical protein DNHGIG_00270 [Collibacillus ludicampi]|jgi:uncharacterized RDD family membrane protein YckC|uniref:RDD domain-containing protein n=1 Tax=Collibacillus ludicampi TaxID=2771369 RepID=A0AAV4LA03_9BACL|nr:RDD family protein [Collibacillus ludicampi]GIM44478.1 hypothetical protein DNHGIG_00270 [Collibacillus ludicampi]